MRYEEDLGEKGAAIINKNWTDDRHKENQLSETSEENSKMRSCIVDWSLWSQWKTMSKRSLIYFPMIKEKVLLYFLIISLFPQCRS